MLAYIFERVWHGWSWRRAGVVMAGTAAAVAAALMTRHIDSLAASLAVLIGAPAVALTLLLYLVDRSEAQRLERDAGFQRIRRHGERLAIYDRETGLYAYWYFSLRLQEETERARRYSQPVSLVLVEGTRARLTPDEEQHLFAALIQSFRTSDVVAHLGNLRFVALLTNTDSTGATIAIHRLREAAAPIDLHAGTSSFPSDGEDWESLLRAAGASADAISDAKGDIESVRHRGLPDLEDDAARSAA